MKKNATLTIEFSKLKKNYSVTWEDCRIVEGESIAEEIFFSESEEMETLWLSGEKPEMTIYLNANPKVRCQVHFEEMAGDLWPSKSPEQAQQAVKTPKIKK